MLEYLFPADWLEKKARYAFILGFCYSVISIAFAKIIFPKDPALVAVAFTSLLLLPELYKMFALEERKERVDKNVNLKEVVKSDSHMVKVYVFLFLGIFFAYSLAAMLLPAMQSNDLFHKQIAVRGGLSTEASGGAYYTTYLFKSILSNNFMVFLVVFIMAFLSGNGAVFIIVWNASLWGTVFGIIAKCASSFSGYSPYFIFFIVFMTVLPHMLIEALSYICGAISGSLISNDILAEKFGTINFKRVLKFNFYLLLIGLALLLLGALVETFVLEHANYYAVMIEHSFSGIC